MLGGKRGKPEPLPRTVEDIAVRAAHVAAATQAENRTKREIAKIFKAVSRVSGDGEEIGGTALTILKRRQPPMATLIEKNRIGGEELMAADDICRAFFAISGALMLKPRQMERVDKSHFSHEPAGTIDAVARYQSWANYWSSRRGDKTLEVTIAAVIDERPLSAIEDDVGLRHGRAAHTLIVGLRDYAERAEWVDHKLAAQWRAEASKWGLKAA